MRARHDLGELPVLRPPLGATFGEESWSGFEQDCKANGLEGVIRLGIIGYGYWGPNIVRSFYGLTNCKVVAVCDKDPTAVRRVLASYPGVEVTRDVMHSPQSRILGQVTNGVAVRMAVLYLLEQTRPAA